jgi:hypothetical protein
MIRSVFCVSPSAAAACAVDMSMSVPRFRSASAAAGVAFERGFVAFKSMFFAFPGVSPRRMFT